MAVKISRQGSSTIAATMWRSASLQIILCTAGSECQAARLSPSRSLSGLRMSGPQKGQNSKLPGPSIMPLRKIPAPARSALSPTVARSRAQEALELRPVPARRRRRRAELCLRRSYKALQTASFPQTENIESAAGGKIAWDIQTGRSRASGMDHRQKAPRSRKYTAIHWIGVAGWRRVIVCCPERD